MIRCLALTVLAVALAGTAQRPAVAAPAPHADDVIAKVKEAWTRRQDNARTVLYAFRTKETMALPPLPSDAAPPSEVPQRPMRTHVSARELRLSGKMMDYRSRAVGGDKEDVVPFHRTAYDGEQSKRFAEFADGTSEGTVSSRANEYNTDRICLRPLILAFRPFHADMGKMSLDDFTVSTASGVVDGEDCIILEEQGDKRIKANIWVAPAQDYAMVRFIERYKGRDSFRIDITNVQDAEHGWLPHAWKVVSLLEDGSLSMSSSHQVTEYALNSEMPRSEFQITFPQRIRVQDRETGRIQFLEETSEHGWMPWLLAGMAIALLLVLLLRLVWQRHLRAGDGYDSDMSGFPQDEEGGRTI